MRFRQTRDVLHHAERLHLEICDLYHRLAEQSQKQRVKLMLDYMSQREKKLAKALETFTGETSQNILDTWFQFADDEDRLKWPDCTLPTEVPADDVLGVALKLADCFINLYRDIATHADSEDVRKVFDSLLAGEELEKQKLVRNAQLFDDL